MGNIKDRLCRAYHARHFFSVLEQIINDNGGVLSDPKLLVVVIVYSGVAQFGLTAFPPLEQFGYLDLLRFHVLLFLVTRITLTYGYAAIARAYTVQMFLLELFIAVLFAGQLRVLDRKVLTTFVIFYFFHLLLMVTAFMWNEIGRREVPALRKQRYVIARCVSIALMFVGIVCETTIAFAPYREASRWFIATSLAVLSSYYLSRKPWEL